MAYNSEVKMKIKKNILKVASFCFATVSLFGCFGGGNGNCINVDAIIRQTINDTINDGQQLAIECDLKSQNSVLTMNVSCRSANTQFSGKVEFDLNNNRVHFKMNPKGKTSFALSQQEVSAIAPLASNNGEFRIVGTYNNGQFTGQGTVTSNNNTTTNSVAFNKNLDPNAAHPLREYFRLVFAIFNP